MVRALLLSVLSAALGATVALWWHAKIGASTPPQGLLIAQVREVARLESLDVSLHKKVTFEPDPHEADGTWGDLLQWAQQTLRPSRGKVIVFAVAHMGLDLSKLDAESLRVEEQTVFMVLPPPQVQIELLPGETEVIGSNLDTEQTAALMERARSGFTQEVAHDARLNQRARASAENAIRSLLLGLGFARVEFVQTLPAVGRAAN